MILFGASGHSLVVKEIIESRGEKVLFYMDDDPAKFQYDGIEVKHENVQELAGNEPVIVSIGDNLLRYRVSQKLSCIFGKAIAPGSFISQDAMIAEGTVVFYNVAVQSKTTIGKHCILNNACSVDHECIIGDFVHIAPGVILCGAVKVGSMTMIGAGSTVIQGITIGSNVTIGAGSVIIKDVPDNAVVVGNPGRIIKYKND
ncbi:acetyltransferase [Saccharicrinis sp. FJH54]|uniref:acetyltransferase n=1 Tax=Saccharicrinis sp. FJH54 TaxID=3344665 RepID=UPI0035D4CD09